MKLCPDKNPHGAHAIGTYWCTGVKLYDWTRGFTEKIHAERAHPGYPPTEPVLHERPCWRVADMEHHDPHDWSWHTSSPAGFEYGTFFCQGFLTMSQRMMREQIYGAPIAWPPAGWSTIVMNG